jgi:hypothetical protein
MRQKAPWLAEMAPTVEEAEFAGEPGYVITYERRLVVDVEGNPATFHQIFAVGVNAVTGEVSVSRSQ